LQQNAFDAVDAATSVDRQRFVFDKILEILEADFTFKNKDEARHALKKISSMFINWNYAPWDQSVVPESEQQEKSKAEEKDITEPDQKDKPADKPSAEDGQATDRDDFKEVLGQIDQYVQSLLKNSGKSKAGDDSDSEDKETKEKAVPESKEQKKSESKEKGQAEKAAVSSSTKEDSKNKKENNNNKKSQ
jgi:hypothetical protein